jgi:hypothetical protein
VIGWTLVALMWATVLFVLWLTYEPRNDDDEQW